jgi:peptide/nickel transport system substrate-binding protein
VRGKRTRAWIAGLAGAAVVAGAATAVAVLRTQEEETPPLRIGSAYAPASLDPAVATDPGSRALAGSLYQSLLSYPPGSQPGAEPVPDAAESCGFDGEELTVYRCTLRDGLTFSSGRPVTPHDVRFSVERAIALADQAGDPGPLAGVREVRVDGQDVVFRLDGPDATFPHALASGAAAVVDRQDYEAGQPRTDGQVTGSGPYRLAGYEPGEYAELEPNPDYRGAARVPAQPVTVHYLPAGRLADAWQDDEFDVLDGSLPPEELAAANQGGGDYRVQESAATVTEVLAFDTAGDGPMAEPAARRAAAALLDREALARHVRHDTVEALYALVPVGYAGHGTPYFDAYEDRPSAGDLSRDLRQAGLTVPVALDLAYPAGPGEAAREAEAQLIAAQLGAEGLFDVTVRAHEPGQPRDADAYLTEWWPQSPDPAAFADALLGPRDALGTGFTDPDLDRPLDAARAEPDRSRAARDLAEADRLAADEAPVLPVWQAERLILHRPGVTGADRLTDASGAWRPWELARE